MCVCVVVAVVLFFILNRTCYNPICILEEKSTKQNLVEAVSRIDLEEEETKERSLKKLLTQL